MPKRIKTISFPGAAKKKKRFKANQDPFYNSAAWVKLRKWFMGRVENVWCAHCLKAGVRTAAVICDHIVPRQFDRSRELDPTNLQPLCRACDNRKTAEDVRQRKAGAGVRAALARRPDAIDMTRDERSLDESVRAGDQVDGSREKPVESVRFLELENRGYSNDSTTHTGSNREP